MSYPPSKNQWGVYDEDDQHHRNRNQQKPENKITRIKLKLQNPSTPSTTTINKDKDNKSSIDNNSSTSTSSNNKINNHRGKSLKEKVDNWFLQSFNSNSNTPTPEPTTETSAAERIQQQQRNESKFQGLYIDDLSNRQLNNGLNGGGNSNIPVYSEIKSKKGVKQKMLPPPPPPKAQQKPYRGSKTTSNCCDQSQSQSQGDDWGFLTQLNEILKRENFLVPSNNDDSHSQVQQGSSNSNGHNSVIVDDQNDFKVNFRHHNNNPYLPPVSPKPPKPMPRRAERRKTEMSMKTRSMPLPLEDEESMKYGYVDLVNPQQVPVRCISPFQQQHPVHLSLPPLNSPQLPKHQPQIQHQQINYHQQQQQSPNNLARVNAISSSLDSIYDRLKNADPPILPQDQRATFSGEANEYFNDYTNTDHGGCNGNINNCNYIYGSPHYNNYMGHYGPNHSYNNVSGSGSGGGNDSNVYSIHPQHQGNNIIMSNGANNNTSSKGMVHPQSHHQQNGNGIWVLGPESAYKSRSYGSLKGSLVGLDYEDRLVRLESDKDTLNMQVSVLSDQIDAQTSKIRDLEKMLDDKRSHLDLTEDQLHKELLSRSNLETQKLELMSEISSLRLKHASLEKENVELKGYMSSTDLNLSPDGRLFEKPPLPNHHSTQIESRVRLSSLPTENSSHNFSTPSRDRARSPAANHFRRVDANSFGTLPRVKNMQLSTFNGNSNVSGQAFGGNSYSSGNIHFPGQQAAIERNEWERRNNNNIGKQNQLFGNNKVTSIESNGNGGHTSNNSGSGGGGHKSRGIMRIFTRLKRSNSGGTDENSTDGPANGNGNDGPAFVRGGFRATAAPRLGWQKEGSPICLKPEGATESWNSDAIVAWMNFLGLGMYANEIKRWVKTGQQMLDATEKELEKELTIKNPLHRKKFNLALHHLRNPDEEDYAGKLDHHWITRWLDDVGLPQYKEYFGDARIDGRVLSLLTQDDLISLKVTSSLHHASIKRGIQLLRIHKFNPGIFVRRAGPPPANANSMDYGLLLGQTGPKNVATWTNHRVMEWLKAIDLAEYAPNLRGSGVHGALIIFESRFNADLMATLLSIPNNKTLLRRHLCLQFSELIGRPYVNEKRSCETSADFIPMNPTIKVKPIQKSKFPLRKKRLSSEIKEDLLCPMDLNVFPTPNDTFGQVSLSEKSKEATEKGSNNVTELIEDKISNI